jgi:hypothetical protein
MENCHAWAQFGQLVGGFLAFCLFVFLCWFIGWIVMWFSRIGKMWRALDMAQYGQGHSYRLNKIDGGPK